jgi:multiple sugar transport system permease protein
MKKEFRVWGYVFAFPALAMVTLICLVPVIQNIYLSFFESNGISPKIFIGFGNYVRFFKDEVFLRSLLNSILWVAFTLVTSVTFGLLLAVFVKGIKGEKFFRSIFFAPLTISFVSVGAIWTYMFSRDYGVINEILSMCGGVTRPAWLFSIPLNTVSMMIAWAWQQLGYNLVMFLAGLTSIPSEPLEASMIDGCNKWQQFIYVIFPMLKPVTTVVVGMAIVNSFKVFDIIYLMTRGGPIRSSETLAVTMFVEGFQRSNRGYGAAIGVLLSFIMLPISIAYIRSMRKTEQVSYK